MCGRVPERIGFVVSGGFPLPDDAEELSVETPWGDVRVHLAGPDRSRVYVRRHGEPHQPPHRVRHRANVDALHRCGVARALAVHNTGALHAPLPVPSFVVPDDLVDFSGHPDVTFHEDDAVHVDLTAPYCATLRAALVEAATAQGRLPARDGGTYVTTRGPRLETRAEVRHLATMGDLVGMTGGQEATLMRERGICYATLCVPVNHAAGVAGPRLEGRAILSDFARLAHEAAAVLDAAAARLEEAPRSCACGEAPRRGAANG